LRESFHENVKVFRFSQNITLLGKLLMVFLQKNRSYPKKQLKVHDTKSFAKVTVFWAENFTLLGKLNIRALKKTK
jgi:hypothetical protein